MLTEKDFVLMSWNTYQEYINLLAQKINNFLQENKLTINFVVPILRGGAIPAISLAYQLNVFETYPIQLKHDYKNQSIIILENSIEHIDSTQKSPVILLVDGYHATGRTTYYVYDIIKEAFPSSKIIYVTLGRDVGYLENQRSFIFSHHAFVSNECNKIPKEQSEKEGMLVKYTLFPWEVLEDEIQNMNDELKYGG